MGHIVMNAVIFIVATLLFIDGFGYPELPAGMPDAGFWSRIVGALLMFFSALALRESFINWRKIQKLPPDQRPKKEDAKGYDPQGRTRLLITLAVLSLYIFVGLPYIGFILSTLIFIPALMLGLGNRKPITIALNTIGTVVVCYAVFIRLMMIPMPRGVGIFWNFSVLFY